MSHIEFYCLLNSTYKKTSWYTSTHSALNIILASFNRLPYSGWEEGGPKRPPYQFFPCNFYRCTISAKRFWLLLWTLLLHYCKMSMPYLLPGSNYWTWTKSSSQKKRFSGHIEKIYKTEVMITSLIEKLEFPHVTLVTWTHLQHSLNHVINFCWWYLGQKLWHHNLYFKILYFKKAQRSQSCRHYQNCNHIYESNLQILKKKNKRTKHYELKCNLYLYFLK